MHKLATAQNLIKPLEDALRTENRINCNSYVDPLIKEHNFVQNGKTIFGTLENVISTVPKKYISNFIESFANSAVSDENSIVVYKAENIKTTATALKKAAAPKSIGKKGRTVFNRIYWKQAIFCQLQQIRTRFKVHKH